MSEVIWGINPVLEALKARPEEIEEIWIAKERLRGKLHRVVEWARKRGVPVRVQRHFAPPKVPKDAVTQGVVAYLWGFNYVDLHDLAERWQSQGDPPLVVVADEITDPQNLGSLIRSAEAAGAHGLIIPKHRSAGVTGVVVKASAGAALYLPLARVTNLVQALKWLKEQGIWIIGLAGEAQSSLYTLDLTMPVALVVGSEGKGLRPLVREACDMLAAIPLVGRVESLNAAVAGAVALFETLRQRRYAP